ncbi:hypothetical protein [Cupriavidus sp. a3]|uniref:hypothetical protein n=1 Tax=Cupriavidus sp. a3 TaxID=3242158 RepID=UPI003D9C66E0
MAGSLLLDENSDGAGVPGLDHHLMVVWSLARGSAQRPDGGRYVLAMDLPENPVLRRGGRVGPIARPDVAAGGKLAVAHGVEVS